MTTPSEDTLRELLAQIKDATRLAHEALTDLRQERAEMQTWLTGLEQGWKVELTNRISTKVTEELNRFKEVNNLAMVDVEQRIQKRFDLITDLMTGTGTDRSTETIARRIGAAVDHVMAKANQDKIPPALRRAANNH